jgi:CBS domain-containing protein
MQARDVMTTNVITVEPETSVREIAQLLIDNKISGIPVVDKAGQIVGVVTESDLMRRPELETQRHRSWWLSMLLTHENRVAEYIKTHGRCAIHVMTPDVITVQEDAILEEVADTLQKHRIKSVPVVHDGKLVGIVARTDLLHGLIARQTGNAPTVDDNKIKIAFQRELREADVDTRFLNYVVSGGVIHVWGVATSPSEKDATRLAARSVSGVKDVSFNVDVMPHISRAIVSPE